LKIAKCKWQIEKPWRRGTAAGWLLILLFAICILTFAMVSPALAATLTFQWDPNTEPDLAGYRLYQSSAPGQYQFGAPWAVAEIPAGTQTVTVPNVPELLFYWVLTAFDTNGNESGPSNEVATAPFMGAPNAPQGLRLTRVE